MARIRSLVQADGRASHADLRPASPTPKSVLVSEQMKRMPRASSQPELLLRRGLHARGLRFTVNRRDLPGTPDIVLSRARIAVFVDGCFWHGCREHGVLPKNNREWWRTKLLATSERDRRKDGALAALGWLPIHFWEHDPADEAADAVAAFWRSRTGREPKHPRRRADRGILVDNDGWAGGAEGGR